MSEETNTIKPVKKTWLNNIWSAIAGIIIGVAAFFGVSRAEINTLKADAEKAYVDVKATLEAIKNRDYLAAIEAGKNAADTLKTITGEIKEVSEVVKDTAEQYKDSVIQLKAAIDAKDWKTAAAVGASLADAITEQVPAENLTGATKEIFDIVKQILDDINENKYDPVIDLANKLVALFGKKTADETEPIAPVAPADPVIE